MYWAIPAVFIVGSLISRFRSRGIIYTLFAMALVQILVPLVALFISPAKASWEDAGMIGVLIINFIFAIVFLCSGFLFRRASNE